MAGNHNSGRKSDAEILRHYLNLDLANKIANKELQRIDEAEKASIDELRTVVMPVALKGLADKSEVKQNIVIQAPNEIIEKYATKPSTEPDSEGQA